MHPLATRFGAGRGKSQVANKIQLAATNQIATAREFIAGHGGSVEARTRLAEAERQFTIAQAAADPVEALDTIRRSVTLAQDADALARYDAMGAR